MTRKAQEQIEAQELTGEEAQKKMHDQPEPANAAEAKEAGETKDQKAKPEHPEPVVKAELFNLSELASKRRIPGWQQAALLRLMNWQKDKLVTEAEYDAALKALGQRRLGGGRM